MAYPVPVQDIKRVNDNASTRALTGPELRTIFLGMDQRRDELIYSNIKGKNPFKDLRVRQAIDIEAIKAKVMRTLSTPSAIMISPFLFSKSDQFSRPGYDPDGAKALLADAGATQTASRSAWTAPTIATSTTRRSVRPSSPSSPRCWHPAATTPRSTYLLGWTPGSLDSWNVLTNLHGCRDDKGAGGPFNLGGYCNEKVDALSKQVLVENDPEKRDSLIAEAYKMTTAEVAHIPLHQQGLAWGVSNDIELVQRADNQFMMYYVQKK